MKLSIDDIVVKKRVRHDMGDLTLLMASLRKHGQLNPIIVTGNNELIAGHRRLQSAKELGWSTVEVVRLDNLDNVERIQLELDENIQRKELLPDEIQEGYDRIQRLKHPTPLDRIRKFFKRIWEWLFARRPRKGSMNQESTQA